MGKGNKFPAESEGEVKMGAMDSNYKPSESAKKYLLIFKHNRSFELHLRGRVAFTFEPNGSVEVTDAVLNHPDFTEDLKRYFSIKEL